MMWNPKNVVFVCCCFSILILKSCFAGHHVLGTKSREMKSFEQKLLNTLKVYFDLEKCERLKIDLLAIQEMYIQARKTCFFIFKIYYRASLNANGERLEENVETSTETGQPETDKEENQEPNDAPND